MKEIVVSGIRSTGNLHLGNYYGALRNFVKMQEESKYNSYFFIADLHALTTHPDPKTLHENVRNILANIWLPVLILRNRPCSYRAMYLKFPKCIC